MRPQTPSRRDWLKVVHLPGDVGEEQVELAAARRRRPRSGRRDGPHMPTVETVARVQLVADLRIGGQSRVETELHAAA